MTYTPPDSGAMKSPPRLLLWLAIVLLAAVILALLGGALFVTGSRRIGSVAPAVALAVVGLPLLSVGLAFLMRRSLPPRLWVYLIAGWVLFFGCGAVIGVLLYRDALPPRYQQEMLTYVPALQRFMHPTPQGGTVPTAAPVSGGISAADLLAMPANTETVEPVSPTPTTELTATQAALAPSATATPPVTLVSPNTPVPTESAAADASLLAVNETRVERPTSAFMYGFRWERQEWNNCGPTNITMALSHFGWQEDAAYAASYLRPNEEDKNVSPGELVSFVNDHTGVRAITRIGGDVELLKQLIASNFPVVIETTFTPEGYDWIGHYQTVVGYDDTQSNFYVYDSYLGTGDGNGVPEPYQQFNDDWQAFNRVFIVLYEPEREAELIQLLGDRADVQLAAQMALETARNEARQDPTNPFAWFNMGSSLVRLEEYEQAAAAFDEATRRQLPFRMLWYQFGPFAAYFEVGRYDDVMSLVQNNLTNGAEYVEETYYWQGRVYEARGEFANAARSYQLALDHNPNLAVARQALDALPA